MDRIEQLEKKMAGLKKAYPTSQSTSKQHKNYSPDLSPSSSGSGPFMYIAKTALLQIAEIEQ